MEGEGQLIVFSLRQRQILAAALYFRVFSNESQGSSRYGFASTSGGRSVTSIADKPYLKMIFIFGFGGCECIFAGFIVTRPNTRH